MRAKETFDSLNSRHFSAMAESELGHLMRREGDEDAAENFYHRTLLVWHDLGHRAAMAHELEVLAFIASHRGEYERAATLFGAAKRIRQEAGIDMLPHEQTEYDGEVATLRDGGA